MPAKNYQELLEKYAQAIVRVGLNLRPGQRLIIHNSLARGVVPAARPLVHAVARAAYGAGARYVEVIWGDEEMQRIRVQHAPADSFDQYPRHQISALLDMIEHGDAMLTVGANDPDAYDGLDTERLGLLQQTHLKHWAAISAHVSRNSINWCVVAAASPAWAHKIFPELPETEALPRLWEAIFDATRATQPDAVAAWQAHIRGLRQRGDYLQARQYTALHYRAPGTDLTLGLPAGHKWTSAQAMAQNGVIFTANMPTEEVFTLPDRQRAEGTVTATFPLSHSGNLIEDFNLTFENGRIVKVQAKRNQALLQKLVDTDEGSTRLGEVALVPASSPIAKRGHLFYSTLFDENASCHLAIGRAYRFSLVGGEELTDEEFMAAGGNLSLNHVDFMIGSPAMDIDGLQADGAREPVMRGGEWAFDV